MSMYEQFETDTQSEKGGIWLDYGDFMVKIARAGGANKTYQKTLDRVLRKYRRAIATDNMDMELADDLVMKVFAQTVILDWKTRVETGGDKDGFKKGIEQKGSDKLLPVNHENVLATLRALPDLFADIQEQARNATLYKSHLRDEVSGNL